MERTPEGWPPPRQPQPSWQECTVRFLEGETGAAWEGLCSDDRIAEEEARLAIAQAASARFGWDRDRSLAWSGRLGPARIDRYGRMAPHHATDMVRIPLAAEGSSRRLLAVAQAAGAVRRILTLDANHGHAGSEGLTLTADRDAPATLAIRIDSVSRAHTIDPPPARAIVMAAVHVAAMTDLAEDIAAVTTEGDCLPASATARALLATATLELLARTGRPDLASALGKIAGA